MSDNAIAWTSIIMQIGSVVLWVFACLFFYGAGKRKAEKRFNGVFKALENHYNELLKSRDNVIRFQRNQIKQYEYEEKENEAKRVN